MSDDTVRARVIARIRAECSFMTADIATEWKSFDRGLPKHRVSQLSNSLAWHASRGEAGQRLREFARELARLWQKAGKQGPEAVFYVLLMARLGLGEEIDQLRDERRDQIVQLRIEHDALPDDRQGRDRRRRLRRREAVLEEEMRLYDEAAVQVRQARDRQPWGNAALAALRQDGHVEKIPLARLLLALSAVSIIDTFNRSVDLREAIGEEALIWQ